MKKYDANKQFENENGRSVIRNSNAENEEGPSGIRNLKCRTSNRSVRDPVRIWKAGYPKLWPRAMRPISHRVGRSVSPSVRPSHFAFFHFWALLPLPKAILPLPKAILPLHCGSFWHRRSHPLTAALTTTHTPPKPHPSPSLWLLILCCFAGQRPFHLQICWFSMRIAKDTCIFFSLKDLCFNLVFLDLGWTL